MVPKYGKRARVSEIPDETAISVIRLTAEG